MKKLTELIPIENKNRPSIKITPSKITIHNTSNKNSKANALAHSKFVRKKGYYKSGNKKIYVSWHFTVDDEYIIKQLPINEKAYHAKNEANLNSLGIEVCMHQGINQTKANDNAAQLVAYLCKNHDFSKNDIVTHKYWTGKNCPQLLLENWSEFLDKVKYHYDNFQERELNRFEKDIIDSHQNQGISLTNNKGEIDLNEIDFKFVDCLLNDED